MGVPQWQALQSQGIRLRHAKQLGKAVNYLNQAIDLALQSLTLANETRAMLNYQRVCCNCDKTSPGRKGHAAFVKVPHV